ncbi:YihY/virulence factor BrkB family protein [Bdellovibrio sp. NC01]|uniref:YihY/virulence factor BrkB family protein n=1 Tax=Bdellovibrio sp. NC01 TaxID=2220073 RepID=UPI00115BD59A|nr:YihY/virulence factor BrkB family protein [Bdellovibrio sp. NC01]QDK36305.1 hypothetical protein DOE51_01165 [Bdellovibrio sp. NC01]
MVGIKEGFHRLTSKEFFEKMSRDDILEMSASLAFYTALSLAPLLVLLLTFVSLINVEFREELLTQIQGLVGAKASELIREIARNVDQRPDIRDMAGIFGLLVLLFSAGAIFGDMRGALNRIFEVHKKEESNEETILQSTWQLLKTKLFNMGMVLTFVFISIISLIVSTGLSFYLDGSDQWFGQLINFGVSLAVFWILFSALYYFLPETDVSKRVAGTSGLVTAILFSLGKTAIGLYLGQSAAASLYGAAGSFIVLLMWVYYSSAVIFLSAEIAYQFNRKEDHEESAAQPKPR